MTPARTSGDSGNFEMDLRFRAVGRIRRGLGTSSKKEFSNRIALLRKIEKQEKFDILRAFRDKKISIEQLIEADRAGRLGLSLSSVTLSSNLWTSVNEALNAMLPKRVDAPEYRKRKKTVTRYMVSMRSLQRKAVALGYLSDKSKIADLADVPWAELLDEWGDSATDWMHMREAVSRFLTAVLKDRFHPFAREIRGFIPTKKIRMKKVGVTYETFLKIIAKVPAHAAPSYWTIALTGMRVGEYLRCRDSHLHADTFVLDVPGTKTDGSEAPQKIDARIWPIVAGGIPSKLQYAWLRKYWNRACVKLELAEYVESDKYKSKKKYSGPTIHWLRHSAGQWARAQGVAAEKVQDFYRHETAEMTSGYLMLEATGEVSKALADLLEQNHKPAPTKSRRRA